MKQEFNLLDEAWISVRTHDCRQKEVGIKELLLHAEEYADLAGETKTQDFALLRLILALMHTIFSRYDIYGEKRADDDDIDFSSHNWEEIWRMGRIPPEPIEKYFSEWYDRFWLFDEKYPFYQSNEVNGVGNLYSTAKMIGTLVESGNKTRLFADYTGKANKNARIIPLEYKQAARWLINLQCFDDIAAKKSMQVPKQPWVGRLHLIAVKGENLFETIMLNYVADYDSSAKERPSWEMTDSERRALFPKEGSNKTEVAIPNNQAELLTLQSRCVYLYRENEQVVGYYIAGGAYFAADDLPLEKMTIWRYNKKDKIFKPEKCDKTKFIWQEFGDIVTDAEKSDSEKWRKPGVISYFNCLLDKGKIDEDHMLKTVTASVIYNYDQATSLPIVDTVSDSLTFHAALLRDAGERWRYMIIEKIAKCEEAARKIASLSISVQEAAGASGDKLSGDTAKQQFYHRIDHVFRLWLKELDVKNDIEEYQALLERDLRQCALNLGSEMVADLEARALLGYKKTEKGKNTGDYYSAAKAYNIFAWKINEIFKAGENRAEIRDSL